MNSEGPESSSPQTVAHTHSEQDLFELHNFSIPENESQVEDQQEVPPTLPSREASGDVLLPKVTVWRKVEEFLRGIFCVKTACWLAVLIPLGFVYWSQRSDEQGATSNRLATMSNELAAVSNELAGKSLDLSFAQTCFAWLDSVGFVYSKSMTNGCLHYRRTLRDPSARIVRPQLTIFVQESSIHTDLC